MHRIAICDDEVIFANRLKKIIENYLENIDDVYDIDIYNSGESFIENSVKIINYDIIFLDINMENIDGLQVAGHIRKMSDQPYIVFVTAFINYSLEGYNYNAVRYLLKTNNKFEDYVFECMDAIMQKMNYSVNKVEIDFIEGKKTVSLNRIIYIESSLHKLEYHILEEDIHIYTQYATLNTIESFYIQNNFIRVHQSFLVNMLHINNIISLDGKSNIIMSDGATINIPKVRRKEVMDKYVAYKGEF